MKNFEKLFIARPDSEDTKGLALEIMKSIEILEDRKRLVRARINGIYFMLSTIASIWSVWTLFVSLKASGTFSYLSLIITDYDRFANYWQDFFMLMLDIAPTFAILGCLILLSATLITGRSWYLANSHTRKLIIN